jgi:hypothetical protein
MKYFQNFSKSIIFPEMERQIPDVWNIFSLSGPNYGLKSQQGDDSRRPQIEAGIHVNWSPKNQDLLLKWCDR